MNLKKLAVLFISAVVFVVFGITASAEGELKINVEYDYYGLPFVSVTPSAEGNVIRYTTDGSKPTFHSAPIDADREFAVYEKTTFRVAEFTPDGTRVAGVKKTIAQKVAPVEFDFEYEKTETVVRLSCATAGATIRYTTDGTKPDGNSAVYTEPLRFKTNTKVRACAYLDGYTSSGSYSATAKISAGKTETAKVDAIKYSQSNLSDKGVAYITFLPQKISNVIYYTTDGSDPSTSSKKYSKRIRFDEPGVLRALEYTAKGDFVASIKMNVSPRVTPVELSCVDFATGTRTIALSCETQGATIYYTIDGTRPSAKYSQVYTAPVVISNNVRIQAMAVKDGYKNSTVSGEYGKYVPVVLKDFSADDPAYREIQTFINDRRIANGLRPITLDEALCKAATIRAKEISVLYDNVRPNDMNYYSVLEEVGCKVSYSMESLGIGDTAREFAIDILSRNEEAADLLTNKHGVNAIGAGYFDQNGKRYWVLLSVKLD
ncbi:MAG: chitobiase/beta-hexosaminidase C-terminal domain-containing protein [Ruminiclostridium sp.]|nr:chitobiase/beta-hexosaminidase C-terminal domain-containing protein [Ruminiclostridium sp.]